ncbi:hypothetical protein BT69DRAFT_1295892 [Atractiella rhizophila]|nr:hypothetical protein BT69DRAFT_1295892 [Atractiella rhizophila]
MSSKTKCNPRRTHTLVSRSLPSAQQVPKIGPFSLRYSDNETSIQYSKGWKIATSNNLNVSDGVEHVTTTPGSSAFFLFRGISIAFFGRTGPDHGQFEIEVDDYKFNGTALSQEAESGQVLFQVNGLRDDELHLMRFKHDDKKGVRLDLDGLVVQGNQNTVPFPVPNGSENPFGNSGDPSTSSLPSSLPPTASTSASASTSTSISSSTSTTTTSRPTSTSVVPHPPFSNSSAISTRNAAIGGTVGGVVGVALLGWLIFLLLRRRKNGQGLLASSFKSLPRKWNLLSTPPASTVTSPDPTPAMEQIDPILASLTVKPRGGGSFQHIRTRSASPAFEKAVATATGVGVGVGGGGHVRGRSDGSGSIRLYSAAPMGMGGSGGRGSRQSFSGDPYLSKRSQLSVMNPDVFVEPSEDRSGGGAKGQRGSLAIDQAWIYEGRQREMGRGGNSSGSGSGSGSTGSYVVDSPDDSPEASTSNLGTNGHSNSSSHQSLTLSQYFPSSRRPTLLPISEHTSYRSSYPASPPLADSMAPSPLPAPAPPFAMNPSASGNVSFTSSPSDVQYVGFQEYPFEGSEGSSQRSSVAEDRRRSAFGRDASIAARSSTSGSERARWTQSGDFAS